jgi:hypothetical protein
MPFGWFVVEAVGMRDECSGHGFLSWDVFWRENGSFVVLKKEIKLWLLLALKGEDLRPMLVKAFMFNDPSAYYPTSESGWG